MSATSAPSTSPELRVPCPYFGTWGLFDVRGYTLLTGPKWVAFGSQKGSLIIESSADTSVACQTASLLGANGVPVDSQVRFIAPAQACRKLLAFGSGVLFVCLVRPYEQSDNRDTISTATRLILMNFTFQKCRDIPHRQIYIGNAAIKFCIT
jgi:hypothetical protein